MFQRALILLFVTAVLINITEGIIEDKKIEDEFKTSDDLQIENLVKDIHELQDKIDNLNANSGHGAHDSNLNWLAQEIANIEKAKIDMQLVNLGEELKTALKKRDLKKELNAVTRRIASTYKL